MGLGLIEVDSGLDTEDDLGSTIPSEYFSLYRWDPQNPDEMDQNSDIEIGVIGGIPPYSWSVSGSGFSLSQSQTVSVSNTLNADSTACGAATITVTDALGDVVTGYVRCTIGQWVFICFGENTAGTCAGRKDYVEIIGDARLILGVGCHYSPYECIFYSCGGYTSYLPETEGELKCGSSDWTGGCDGGEYYGCYYYNVYLRVWKWECP